MVKKLIKRLFKYDTRSTVGTKNESTRVEWLEKTLKKIPSGYRILDAGAGEQQFRKFCNHLNYVSQDFAAYKPEELNTGLQMQSWDYGNLDIISDIADIPEENCSFDAIMCTEVFEHIVNPREAITEFSRLLKEDGFLIITAPFCSLTHFAPYHFYTGFNQFFYREELEKKGFEIIEISPNGNYFEFLAQEINRVEEIAKKYSNKEFSSKEKVAIKCLLTAFENFSASDTGSSELLNFGFHVFAQKK